jgi:hypothetical protein
MDTNTIISCVATYAILRATEFIIKNTLFKPKKRRYSQQIVLPLLRD